MEPPDKEQIVSLDFSSHLRHKRPNEWGRGTQECVRHALIRQPAWGGGENTRVCRVGTHADAQPMNVEAPNSKKQLCSSIGSISPMQGAGARRPLRRRQAA